MATKYAAAPSKTSAAAARLASDEQSDSGYGGSVVDGEELSPSVIFQPEHSEKRQWASHVHQMAYNQNRVALGRSINRTVDTLKRFQKMNTKWPAHYPTVQKVESQQHPSIRRAQSTLDDINDPYSPRPSLNRRAATTLDDPALPQQQPSTEPRLVTPQIAEDFNVLKLDLKLGALSPSELVHSLEKSSVASLLDGKIAQAIKHLSALRDRIEDTSSKVLVTGDVNAGKSSFCNALLRRKILPEDQQPCTSAFCEVLDARENNNVEEVHALHKDGPPYDRHDESTYDVYSLDQLEDIVVDNEDQYTQVKIYVEDVRTIDQSLLRNGVVDISLIDAPGLNTDSMTTTAVFARQEEIDVVVYVVAAENHFTLSAKEFIWNAANEKAYIFIVVNRFDNIRERGKDKCRKAILDQVSTLSPQTFKDSNELVHFVSANAIVDGSDPEKLKSFEELEHNLRSFVLDKRARSKLAPAQTYLLNLLSDLETLAKVNVDTVTEELRRIEEELEKIAPAYERAAKARSEVAEECDKIIEATVTDVYKDSRESIANTISCIDDAPVVPFSNIFDSFRYAEATKQAMLKHIQSVVIQSEKNARAKTAEGVSQISGLGMLHLGDEYTPKSFRPEMMYASKRNQLSRQLKVNIEWSDFFDFDRQEKLAGAGMSLTVATMAGSQVFGVSSWVDGLWKATNLIGVKTAKKLVLPVAALAVVAGGWYILSDMPKAVPRKLAKKIRKQLADLDYVHTNADRIAKECRKVLRFPAEDLRAGFQKSVEKQGKMVRERKETKKESEGAFKFFGGLLKEAREQKRAVSTLDLEGHTLQ